MQCPFCSSAIENATFAQSEYFRAVVNIAPILPGHSMIIPKRHIASIHKLTQDEMIDFISFSRKITQHLVTIFKAEGFDWSLQEGICAGQTVHHMHLHIVIRTSNDLKHPGDWYDALQDQKVLDSDKRNKLSNEQMQMIIQQLRINSNKKDKS